jgi:transposase InsO family protein
VHGLRGTFRTKAQDETDFEEEIVEHPALSDFAHSRSLRWPRAACGKCHGRASEPSSSRAPILLDRQFAVVRPNREWIADFTYIWTADDWRGAQLNRKKATIPDQYCAAMAVASRI